MTGIIILAAGPSSRLGVPKQNLLYHGKTLLQHSIDTALATECRPVILILGANQNTISFSDGDSRFVRLYNPNWQQGMSSSIHMGLQELLKITPNIANVIFMLCDQPLVDSSVVNKLVEQKETSDKNIVACNYAGTMGVPVLFSQHYFTHLMALQNEQGAKNLLNRYAHDVDTIEFEPGKIDIDTPEDYEALLRNEKEKN